MTIREPGGEKRALLLPHLVCHVVDMELNGHDLNQSFGLANCSKLQVEGRVVPFSSKRSIGLGNHELTKPSADVVVPSFLINEHLPT